MCLKLKFISAIILFVTVNQINCELHNERDTTGVYMPVYAFYLIGLAMLLKFLVIMYLIFILQKSKFNNSHIPTFVRQDSSLTVKGQYKRQPSEDKTANHITGMSLPLIQCEEIKIEDTPLTMRDINYNATSTTSLNKPTPKISILRNHAHPNPILPEQMKKICEEALDFNKNRQNTASNTASNEISKLIDDIELRPNNYSKGLIREKSASTPVLDVYDTLPAPKEVNEAIVLDEPNSNDEKENADKPSVVHDKRKSDSRERDDESDEEGPDDIYDCPPASKKPIIVEDEEYMFPVSRATSKPDLIKDPSYINAKNTNFIL